MNADGSANASRITSFSDAARTLRNGVKGTSFHVARPRNSPTSSAELGRRFSTMSSTTAPRWWRRMLGTRSVSASTSGARWPCCVARGRAPSRRHWPCVHVRGRTWGTRHARICWIASSMEPSMASSLTIWSPLLAATTPALARLIGQAEKLAGLDGDPKLQTASKHVAELVAGRVQRGRLLSLHRDGSLRGPPSCKEPSGHGRRRRDRRDASGRARGKGGAYRYRRGGGRVLIATDCLSEGINLQEYFDAVVHYDLSWNPTRHEQREGRVDRFGQPSRTVRATLLYGVDNPMDGAVLRVILRKAARIREELGVPVPIPDEGHSLSQALLKAVLLRRRGWSDATNAEQLELFERQWEDTRAKAKSNRTVFAQRRIQPDEVLPEWHKSLAAIGGREDVRRFAGRALARLGSGLEVGRRGFKVPTMSLPDAVRERLEAESIAGTVAIDFAYPAAPGCRPVQRSHPLIAVLADTLLGRTLEEGESAASTGNPAVLGRVGCWISEASPWLGRLWRSSGFATTCMSRRGHHETTSDGGGGSSARVGRLRTRRNRSPGPMPCLLLERLTLMGDPPRHVREREARTGARAASGARVGSRSVYRSASKRSPQRTICVCAKPAGRRGVHLSPRPAPT